MASGIHIKPSHHGLLHKAMGVKEGQKLSLSSIAATKARAKRNGNTKLEKQAVFAENARKWHHGN
jgi:hypothetical protein